MNNRQEAFLMCLWNHIVQRIDAASEKRRPVVAICGPVAVGKTFWAEGLIRISGARVLQLPFDLWIDDAAVHALATPYDKRFYFARYLSDLHALRVGTPIAVPLVETGTWRKRYSSVPKMDSTAVTMSAAAFWSEHGIMTHCVDPTCYDLVLIDGTLVCHGHARTFFDVMLYIDSAWCTRVARMIGRYRRREGDSQSNSAWLQYAQFLINEAQTVADGLIAAQRVTADVYVDHPPSGNTDLEDLAFLEKQFGMGHKLTAFGITREDIVQQRNAPPDPTLYTHKV